MAAPSSSRCAAPRGSSSGAPTTTTAAPAGGKCRLACLTTPPHLPLWTIWRRRPLLRTPERRPSILEACRGLRSYPQAAPKLRILPFRPPGGRVRGQPAAQRARPRCPREGARAAAKGRLSCSATPPHLPAGCLLGLPPLLRTPDRRRTTLEACGGLPSSPQVAPEMEGGSILSHSGARAALQRQAAAARHVARVGARLRVEERRGGRPHPLPPPQRAARLVRLQG